MNIFPAFFFNNVPNMNMNVSNQPQSTPPASERAIQSLMTVKITIDDLQEDCNKECMVCLEEHKIGTCACKLPCGHIYHRNCLVEWLNKHANCPFCRYELETNDPNYEKQRIATMKNRKLRLRRGELEKKTVSQLRELAASIDVRIIGCLDKSDIIDRIVKSGKIIIAEGAPVQEISAKEFDSMSVKQLQHLLLSFGITGVFLEKDDIKNRLIESGRIRIRRKPKISMSQMASMTVSELNQLCRENGIQPLTLSTDYKEINKCDAIKLIESSEVFEIDNDDFSSDSPRIADSNEVNSETSSIKSNDNYEECFMDWQPGCDPAIRSIDTTTSPIDNTMSASEFATTINVSQVDRNLNSDISVDVSASNENKELHDGTLSELLTLSIRELKSLASERNVNILDCIEKRDIATKLFDNWLNQLS